jgi:hypothetical protein
MTQTLPAYRRRIAENQERKDWPSDAEVRSDPHVDAFTIEYDCHPDCPHLYVCVVVRMKCKPNSRRLWKRWHAEQPTAPLPSTATMEKRR